MTMDADNKRPFWPTPRYLLRVLMIYTSSGLMGGIIFLLFVLGLMLMENFHKPG